MMLDHEIGFIRKPRCFYCAGDAVVGNGTGAGDANHDHLGPALCNSHRHSVSQLLEKLRLLRK